MKGIIEQTQYISVAGVGERYPYIHGSHRINHIYDIVDQYGIDMEETRCNFGGYRSWLICPVCGKKRLSLFYVDDLFQCKDCGNLLYDRQTESRKSRTLSERTIDLFRIKYEWMQNKRPVYNGKWTKRANRIAKRLVKAGVGFSLEEARRYGFNI